MTEIIFTIPLVLALLALILGVVRSMTGAWLNYRIKLRLLEKLEQNPELINSPAEVEGLYERLAPVRQGDDSSHYTVMGTTLALIGAACLMVGRLLRFGQLAAGVYWGGMVCVFLGVALALLGLLIHFIGRTRAPHSKDA